MSQHNHVTNTKTSIASLLQKIDDGYTVITPTKRLARELQHQFSLVKKANNQNVWLTADILPYEAWVMNLWQTIRTNHINNSASKMHAKTQWIVLNSWQNKRLWHQCVENDIEKTKTVTAPLWNINDTVRNTIKAWQIIHRWCLTIGLYSNLHLEDYRCLIRWIKVYQSKCNQNQWLDPESIPSLCVEHFPSNGVDTNKIIWLAFDHYTPIQQKLIAALSQSGSCETTDIEYNTIPTTPSNMYSFQDTRQQWLSIAQWLKTQIEKDANYKIAVVVPDIQPYQSQIETIFEQTLCPEKLIDDPNKNIPFHISLGKSTLDYPLVKQTLSLIFLCQKQNIASKELLRLLINPLIRKSDSDYFIRNKLEGYYRQRLPFEMTFIEFAKWLTRSGKLNDTLIQLLEKATEFLSHIENKNTLSKWVEIFFDWLDIFDWPGPQDLSSDHYQLLLTFKQQLSAMGCLDIVDTKTSFDQAYSIFKTHLSEKIFQPKARSTNIEVMGVLECAGLNFDTIWFAGLVEKQWPPSLSRIPFLPHRLLKQAGYIGIDEETVSQHALKLQQKLLNQCNTFIASYHCTEKQQPQLPSPILLKPPIALTDSLIDPPIGESLFKKVSVPHPILETVKDNMGLPLAPNHVAGGATVIEDQASCPFKAYAYHRLSANLPIHREIGLNAQDRGTLIHKILEQIWSKIQDQNRLKSLSTEAVNSLIADTVATQTKKQTKDGLKTSYLEALNSWLESLLSQWLNIEKKRGRFTTIQLESSLSLPLSGLIFNLKIDRIDQLEDGSIAIIDYKSGNVKPKNHWLGDRPKLPQLPLYALAVQHNQKTELSLLCFAHVRSGECQFSGISAQKMMHSAFDKIEPMDKFSLGTNIHDLAELIQYWQIKLENIAEEYGRGVATVAPQDKDTCNYCDLPGFCRIAATVKA